MHLVDTRTLELVSVVSEEEEEYAILSHRWQEDEVIFEDMLDLSTCEKRGVQKLKAFCSQAQEYVSAETCNYESFDFVWVDTCCIDKKSSAELSEAINSMYKYYSAAKACFVYLCDVNVSFADPDFERQLRKSEWFRRCWTLQELIAPGEVTFYNARWERLATKQDLLILIAHMTGIDAGALRGCPLTDFGVAERMAWAAHRQATRREDIAYSLLGIFDINMPMLYGEGNKAFQRLQEEILRQTDDETIFAWSLPRSGNTVWPSRYTGLLAPSPDFFEGCQHLKSNDVYATPSFTLTNQGISAKLKIMRLNERTERNQKYLALLNASFRRPGSAECFVAIYLQRNETNSQHFQRLLEADYSRWEGTFLQAITFQTILTEVIVRHKGSRNAFKPFLLHGFDLSKLPPPSYLRQAVFRPSPFSYTLVAESSPHVDEYKTHDLNLDFQNWSATILSLQPDTIGPFYSIMFEDDEGKKYIDFGFTKAKAPVCVILDVPKRGSTELFVAYQNILSSGTYDNLPWTEFRRCESQNPGIDEYRLCKGVRGEGFFAFYAPSFRSAKWRFDINPRSGNRRKRWFTVSMILTKNLHHHLWQVTFDYP